MISDQALGNPAVDAAPAAQAGAASPPAVSGVLREGRKPPVVRPRETVDTFLALVAFAFALALTHPDRVPATLTGLLEMQLPLRDLLLALGFFLLWPRLLALCGVYEAGGSPARSEVFSVVVACAVGSAVALGFVFFGTAGAIDMRTIGVFWILSTTVTLTFRGFGYAVNTALLPRAPRRVLIVGSGLRALKLSREVLADPQDFELLGFVDDSDESASEAIARRLLGKVDDLERILMHQVVDEVLIALPVKSCYSQIQRAIEVCARVGVESKYLADAFRCQLAKPRFEHHRALPFMTMKVFYDDYRVSVKRLIDFVGALVGLLLLAPVMIGIAIAIKLTSPGPVLFAQERYGLNKRRFKMYKFRTMVPNAEKLLSELEDQNEALGPIFKMKEDPRVTPIGRFLRRTSLDELPQLFNVLKGDMSLVGPRPMAVRDVQLFDQAWFMRRFSAPPGITGLWQVSGRSNLGFDDWVALDLKYIDEWSLALDFKILTRTIPVVVRGVGAM